MMIIVNFVACWWVAFVTLAIMAHLHPPKTRRDYVMQGAAAVVFGSSLVGALIPIFSGINPQWWSLVLSVGLAGVATCVYDEIFGLERKVAELRALLSRWGR